MQRIGVWIPEGMRRRLTDIRQYMGLSSSEVVEKSLGAMIQKLEAEHLRAKGYPLPTFTPVKLRPHKEVPIKK
jgi:hypothetical protein